MLALIFAPMLVTATSSEVTTIYIEPQISMAAVGTTFNVNIKIANVEGLYGWELYLRWTPDILNLTEVTEGPFLNAEGAYRTYFISKIYNEEVGPEGYNGYAALWCTLKGEPPTAAAEGSGILATLTFLVKEKGSSALDLYNTMLLDPDGLEIPHTTEDGYFNTNTLPEIVIRLIDPMEGPPGTKVFIAGMGATPKGLVLAFFIEPEYMVPQPAIGETIADENGYWEIGFEVPQVPPGEYLVTVLDNETLSEDSTTFVVTSAQIRIEYVSPQFGPVGTSVYISGSGATPNGEARVYFDETNVANTTAQDWGWWGASFEVPDVEPGSYIITALDVTTNTTDTATFTVTTPPTIHVSPSEAPIGSKITITGEGFTPNQGIFITFEDLLLFSFITTDENGEFNVTLFVPMINSGNYTIKAITTYPIPTYPAIANASFTVTLGVDTLLSQYASLNSSYDELKNDYEELNASYYEYKQTHEHSNSEYDSLLSDYDDLKSKHDVLTGDLGTAGNLNSIFIITTIIFIATTVYLVIRKPKEKTELKTT